MVAGLSIENKQWMVKNWKNTWKFLTIFLQNTCNKTFRLKREIFNSCFMYLHKKNSWNIGKSKLCKKYLCSQNIKEGSPIYINKASHHKFTWSKINIHEGIFDKHPWK